MSRNSRLSSNSMPRVAILAGPAYLDPKIIAMEKPIQEVDARELQCPMPLLKAKRALNGMTAGERLRVLATDSGSVRDFEVFAQQSGHQLLSSEEREGVYIHVLEKV
jgi:tRNA 2-thiouridine synthesizing protein A